jgi:hypothetical protein
VAKYTIERVAQIVEIEGLEYAILDYMNGDKIADENLAQMWDEAGDLLGKIWRILEPYMEGFAEEQ